MESDCKVKKGVLLPGSSVLLKQTPIECVASLGLAAVAHRIL